MPTLDDRNLMRRAFSAGHELSPEVQPRSPRVQGLSLDVQPFTRLTNAFSKKCANLEHAVELAELVALMPKPVAKAWGSVKRATALG